MAVRFVQEVVIGVGFLGGCWVYVGVNPETEVLKALWQVIAAIEPSLAPAQGPLLWGLSIGSGLAALAGAYVIGWWLGVLAVILAFAGGVLIASIGPALLLVAIVLGLFAPSFRPQS